jgi:hypothetical protein
LNEKMENKMTQQTFAVDRNPRVVITQVKGSLSVQAWKERTISVEMAGTVAELRQEGDTVIINGSEGDLTLWVPGIPDFGKSITTAISVTQLSDNAMIEGVGGVALKAIGGNVALRNIGGDVELENVHAAAELTNIGGDLRATSMPSLAARKGISGDASLSDIAQVEVDAVGGSMELHRAGTAVIHAVGGHLDVEGVEASLRCNAVSGDCRVQGSATAGVTIKNVGGSLQVQGVVRSHMSNVGGNLHLEATFPAGSHAHFHVGGNASIELPEDANLSLHAIAGGSVSSESPGFSGYGNFANLVYGEGAARLDVIAGGSVRLLGSAMPHSKSVGESWSDFGHSMAGIGHEMGRLGREIGREMATAFKGASRHYWHDHVKKERPPTYERDRAAILRMVAEGRITPEEGEMLLSGLEG